MPIYEYICLECKSKFETLRSMKEADTPISCKVCESANTSRLLSLFNAQSGGRVIAGSSPGNCSGCAGGSCASCHN